MTYGARTFDGATSKVQRSIVAMDTGSWTMGAWVKPAAAGGASGDRILSVEAAAGALVHMVRLQASALTVRAHQQGSTSSSATGGALTVGVWRFVVGTYDEADLKARLYYGDLTTGVSLQATGAAVVGRTTGGTDCVVGNRDAQNVAFDGVIGASFVAGRLWSLAEMDHFRRTGRPASMADLRLWLPMLGTGASEPDWSGQGADFVVTDAAVTDGPSLTKLWTPSRGRRLRAA